MDEITTIEKLTGNIIEYREQEKLDQLDNIQTLIQAINVESAELLETITFKNTINKKQIKQGLADVLIYCFALADLMYLDVEDIITDKIHYNKQRNRKYLNHE